jgi:hypothetical protein
MGKRALLKKLKAQALSHAQINEYIRKWGQYETKIIIGVKNKRQDVGIEIARNRKRATKLLPKWLLNYETETNIEIYRLNIKDLPKTNKPFTSEGYEVSYRA